ncbi:MAG TPA: hypothetical protein VIK37_02315 [Candidatus Saccharimonadales bacterium]
MSAKKIGIPALENFKLFYEEIINIKPRRNRIRRIRQISSVSAS